MPPDRRQVSGFREPGQGELGSNNLMGSGFLFEMIMFWNLTEVEVAQRHESTKCH